MIFVLVTVSAINGSFSFHGKYMTNAACIFDAIKASSIRPGYEIGCIPKKHDDRG